MGVKVIPAYLQSNVREILLDSQKEGLIDDDVEVEPYMDDLRFSTATLSFKELVVRKEKVLTKFLDKNIPTSDKEITSEQDESNKILSCGWSGKVEDKVIVMLTWEGGNATTRREWLGQKHSVYDPTGIALEIDMRGRSVTRAITEKFNYDDKLPEEFLKMINEWEEERKNYFSKMVLPRKINTEKVYVFCDASDLAWAVKFFDMQGRVFYGKGGLWKPNQQKAPTPNPDNVPGWTTPRQELFALARATDELKNLEKTLMFREVIIFTDSAINTWRVRRHEVGVNLGEEPYPAWEARNIGVVKAWLDRDSKHQLRHVATDWNLADDASRLKPVWTTCEAAFEMINKAIKAEDRFQVSATSDRVLGQEDLLIQNKEDVMFYKEKRRTQKKVKAARVRAKIQAARTTAETILAGESLEDVWKRLLREQGEEDGNMEAVKLAWLKTAQEGLDLNKLNKVPGNAFSRRAEDGLIVRKFRQTMRGEVREQLVVQPLPEFTLPIVRSYHRRAHQGAEQTKLAILESYYWEGIAREVKRLVANCPICSVARPKSFSAEGSGVVSVVGQAWATIGIDISGPIRPQTDYSGRETVENKRVQLSADSNLPLL